MDISITDFDWPFLDYELPRLNKLSNNLYGASFFLMKLLPARFTIQHAEATGKLSRGGHIIETTSGTFGLALAMICAVKKYRLTLISDPVIDKNLYAQLRELGAVVEILRTPHPDGGYQRVRLERLYKLLEEDPDAFWPDQYGNPYNPMSYGRLAEYLVKRLGRIDCLVGPVGSGGSMVGTTAHLRRVFPDLKAIAVDTPKSVLFGQRNGERLLRGLGNSLLPKNLDHSMFDYVFWVPARMAFQATRELHRVHGLYMGGTSGAAYLVANWWARQNPGDKVVAIFPDEGHRYSRTIYNDKWLSKVPGKDYSPELQPLLIQHPRENEEEWCWMRWNRRRLCDVISSMVNSTT